MRGISFLTLCGAAVDYKDAVVTDGYIFLGELLSAHMSPVAFVLAFQFGIRGIGPVGGHACKRTSLLPGTSSWLVCLSVVGFLVSSYLSKQTIYTLPSTVTTPGDSQPTH